MVESPNGPRFQAWGALFVFSCVTLAAHDSTLPEEKTRSAKWVEAFLCISLIFSFFGVVGYFLKDKFIGTKIEGAISSILVVFYCAGLPTIMNPEKGFAVSTGMFPIPTVRNSNLYFFSWISFICILYIQGHWMQEVTGRDIASEITPKYAKWGGLFAASIVVLASSSKIHIDTCKDFGKGSEFCKRTNYAISLGVLGTVIAMVAIFLMKTGKMSPMMESGTAFLALILYTFGVGFITFGNGPATTISNLYFAVWIGFALTIFLFFECFREFMASRSAGSSENTTDDEKTSAPAPTMGDLEEQPATEGVEVSDVKM
eukprot:CAMPEP_0119015440 /NCGR_PEP_ID=MMETSP1176-20130426/11013_1 /TAXON_ID=265551 /ORGANISM="Synedropsis recta cf, Strain CCMP1620" /LENGTH=315 /DNA_ID=CAMNT_0006968731 /DNA_START=69 /DNA_END=1016 /DNA_ORIENTATION=+